MKPLTDEQRQAVRALACAYDAFNEAKWNKNSTGTRVWGCVLLDIQERIGVELYAPSLIKAIMREAEGSE